MPVPNGAGSSHKRNETTMLQLASPDGSALVLAYCETFDPADTAENIGLVVTVLDQRADNYRPGQVIVWSGGNTIDPADYLVSNDLVLARSTVPVPAPTPPADYCQRCDLLDGQHFSGCDRAPRF